MPGYFHFPLCLLSFEPKSDRLQSIVSYCVVEHASKKTKAGIKASADFLYVTVPDMEAARRRWQTVREFVLRREQVHGHDPFVRVATSLLWECMSGKLSYRDLSILCAINSQIGAKKGPVRITEPSIRVRAAGYKSWRVFEAAVPPERREEALLSPHKVRYTVESLHRRGLFARVCSGPRTVLFMTGVTNEELREVVVKRASQRLVFRQECRQKDAQMRQQIRGIKAINDRKRAINDKNFGAETESIHSPLAGGASHDNSLDINNSIPNSSVLNNSDSNNSVSNTHPTPVKTTVKKPLEELGYIIDGAFVPQQKANSLAQDPDVLMKIINSARRAVRENGAIRELE